jgi:hypothetical protein
MVHGCVYTIFLDKAYARRLTNILHCKAHMFVRHGDVLALC